MANEIIFRPPGAPVSGRITPAVFPFFTTGEDNLRIVSFNSAPGVKLQLVARLLGTDGRPTPSRWDHTPNTDRSLKTSDFTLSGQTLLNVHVTASVGAPLIGQCYVIVQLIRGLGGAGFVVGTLLAGPVTATQSLGFPGSPIQAALDGQGYLRAVVGTVPAAGAEIIETVPTGARWQLLTMRFSMQADANIPNRKTNYRHTAGGNSVYQTANANTWTNGQQPTFSIAPNVGYSLDAASLTFTLPAPQDSTLLAGHTFGTITAGLQVGDQYSSPKYLVREWLDV